MTDSVSGNVQSVEYKSKTDKFRKEILCDPCEEDGESKPVEGFCVECQDYLCDECYHVHRQPKPLRHHRLLSKDEMPKKRVAGSLSEICPKHEGELIKYYCKNHGTVGCNSCMIIEHKPCLEISTLADIAKGVENSSQYREFCTRMTETNEELERQIDNAKNNIKVTETCCTDAIDQVNKLQEEVCKQFDILRKQIVKEAEDMKKNDTERIQRLEELANRARDAQQDLQSNIEVLKETKQSKQLFIAIIRGKEKQTDLEERLKDIKKKNNVKRYCFIPNEFLMCMLQNIDALGELCKYEDGESPVDLKSSYGNYLEYGLTRGTPLSEIRCVVLDSIYNSVKLYRKEEDDNVAVAKMKLSSCPWDVTTVHENKFAVTLPNEKKIKILLATDENITESHDIKVDGRCEGIAYDKDQLFVTCNKPAKVLVLDMKGNVIRNISTDESGQCLFQQPGYIICNKEQQLIGVSDRKTGIVTLMTMNGAIKNLVEHEKLKFPFPLCIAFHNQDDNLQLAISDNESGAFEFSVATGECKRESKCFITGFLKCYEEVVFRSISLFEADDN